MSDQLTTTCHFCDKTLEGKALSQDEYGQLTIDEPLEWDNVGFKCKNCDTAFCYDHRKALKYTLLFGYDKSKCIQCDQSLEDKIFIAFNKKPKASIAEANNQTQDTPEVQTESADKVTHKEKTETIELSEDICYFCQTNAPVSGASYAAILAKEEQRYIKTGWREVTNLTTKVMIPRCQTCKEKNKVGDALIKRGIIILFAYMTGFAILFGFVGTTINPMWFDGSIVLGGGIGCLTGLWAYTMLMAKAAGQFDTTQRDKARQHPKVIAYTEKGYTFHGETTNIAKELNLG